MNTLINNSHYLVTLEVRVDAEGGSNPGGRVVTILKKRKTPVNGYIEIPLSQWRKFNEKVEEGVRASSRVPALEKAPDSSLVRAARNADWGQLLRNGGPPCFHLETDGDFCLRAKRWEGHAEGTIHKYVSLADLLEAR